MKTLSQLGELAIIRAIEKTITRRGPLIADYAEDAAIFHTGNKLVAISTDMGTSTTHFAGSSAFQKGRKIAVSANTDLLAKGAVPKFMWLDFALPPETPISFVEQLYKGMDFELAKFGAFLVGGDTNKGIEFCYSATVFGEIAGKPLLRKNAHAGDLLVLTGEVGNAAAGLFCALKKTKCPKKFADAQNAPQIDFDLCKKLMPIANAGADISDGMAKELSSIAVQSAKKLVIDLNKLPFDKDLPKLCEKHGWDLADLLLHRGEDYQVIYSVPAKFEPAVRKAGGIIFGRVLKPEIPREIGLFLQKGWKITRASAKGYEHFKDN